MRSSSGTLISSASQILGCGAAEPDVVVPRRRAAPVVGAAAREGEALRRIVVARAADHHAPVAGEPLATVTGIIRVGAQDGRRPLAEVAEQVLDARGAPAGRPPIAPGCGVIAPAEDR